MHDPLHPIQVVSDRTGLSAHVIRVWEKRYGAVKPVRTETNRRLYSEEEIDRLSLLGRVTARGHAIGYAVRLPVEKLKLLADETPEAMPLSTGHDLRAPASPADAMLASALRAVQSLDSGALGAVLKQAEVQLGAQGVLHRLVAPLAQAIGEQWRTGALTAAHEHFATAVLRLFLGHAAKPFAAAQNAPVFMAVTPLGQLHELGALLAGAAAANLGWHVIYLGASLAAAEIAGAAQQNRARVVALSIVYPEDDPNLASELTRLRDLLPATAILAGGRAMHAYREPLSRIGAHMIVDLAELGTILDQLRAAR
jgi:MerR family transcriptional regulator, light-induced transcriptional regulator